MSDYLANFLLCIQLCRNVALYRYSINIHRGMFIQSTRGAVNIRHSVQNSASISPNGAIKEPQGMEVNKKWTDAACLRSQYYWPRYVPAVKVSFAEICLHYIHLIQCIHCIMNIIQCTLYTLHANARNSNKCGLNLNYLTSNV